MLLRRKVIKRLVYQSKSDVICCQYPKIYLIQPLPNCTTPREIWVTKEKHLEMFVNRSTVVNQFLTL